MNGGQRWLALDGLRGVAVLMVVLDHAGLVGDSRALGAVGVTIFFVLSGYLITRLVMAAREASEWSMADFLLARTVRLVPALLLMTSVVAAWWLASGRPSAGLAGEVATTLTYTKNIFFAHFDSGLLRHTWSLATEEQFYLLWPLVLPLVLKLRRPAVWIGVAVVASALARVVVLATVGIDAAYALLPTNAYALLLGCCLAVDPIHVASGQRQRLVPIVGLALIVWLAVGADLPGSYVMAPIPAAFVAAVVLAFALPGVPLLEAAWLRFVGRISYALYLWHWPVLILLGEEFGGFSAMPALALSTVLAVASTLLIEEPLRRKWRNAHSGTPSEVAAADPVGRLDRAGPREVATSATRE